MVKVSAGINEFLLQKRAELGVNRASIVSNIYVVDMPHVPSGFVRTDLLHKILLALLFGGALGLGLAFLAEYFDTTVKTPEQIQKIIDLPYLGTIYHFSTEDKSPKMVLQMLEAPYSHIAEVFPDPEDQPSLCRLHRGYEKSDSHHQFRAGGGEDFRHRQFRGGFGPVGQKGSPRRNRLEKSYAA